MRAEGFKAANSLRSLLEFVENHYFAETQDLLRALEIGKELTALEHQGGLEKISTSKRLYSELRSLVDSLMARELSAAILIDGVPLSFFERALDLAEKSTAEDDRVHPKVGALIIKKDVIIAEGYRNQDGKGAHAEEIAIQNCANPKDIEGAVVLTTLEPCTDRGSRGRRPCSEMLIRFGVKKVVIGLLDPNPQIRGRSDVLLRKNGIEVAYFPSGLSSRIWEMNREFIEAKTKEDFKSVFLYRS